MRVEILHQIQGNARRRFERCWSEGITPRVKRSVVTWAREVRKMRGGPIAGVNTIPFSTEFMPHTVDQMDAADDPSVRIIVIWGPIRDAKTTAFLNVIGRTVTDDPGGIFSVWPTQDDSDKFSEDDLETMIELCLEGYFVGKKSRDSGRTKTFKKFRGGSIRLPSAGSITAFRGSTVKALGLHEADALDVESIHKAIGRTKGMSDAIIFLESTGTTASETGEDGKVVWHSVIADHYDKSDQRKWFVECVECGELSVIRYAQIQARSGDHRQAQWHCPRCDFGHEEREWFTAAQSGLWLPTAGLSEEDTLSIRDSWRDAKAKQPEVRGYWRNGFNSLLPKSKGYATKLHEFLAEGESAKSSPAAFKTWQNEIAAELWNPNPIDAEPPPWKPMFQRREDYGVTIPRRGLFLTSFTDVHDNRIEVCWQAWGREEESWVMDHVVLQGSVFQPDVWQLLRRELGRKFQHSLGCTVGLGFGLIDGGDNAESVYGFLGDLRRNPEPGVSGLLHASKGFGAHPHPIIDNDWRAVSKNLKGHHIGTWQAKKLLYTERFRMEPREGWEQRAERGEPLWENEDGTPDRRSGVIHFNRRITQEFLEQCVREVPKMVNIKGDIVMQFEIKTKPRGPDGKTYSKRNEGLDLLVGNLAAVRYYARPWDLLEADLIARAEAVRQPQRRQPEPAYEPQESWVTGGARW